MTILYALVARSKNVLAEHAIANGNFPSITRVLLAKIPDENGKMSYNYESHVFHYVVENHIIYLCLTDDVQKFRLPYAFLEDIRQRFTASYGDRAQTAIAFAMNESFAPILQKRMEYYNDAAADQFDRINKNMDEVRNIMTQNIEDVLARGEKIDLLVDKQESLRAEADKFLKASQKLRRTLWLRKVRNYALIATAIFIIAFIIVCAAVCGFDFSHC